MASVETTLLIERRQDFVATADSNPVTRALFHLLGLPHPLHRLAGHVAPRGLEKEEIAQTLVDEQDITALISVVCPALTLTSKLRSFALNTRNCPVQKERCRVPDLARPKFDQKSREKKRAPCARVIRRASSQNSYWWRFERCLLCTRNAAHQSSTWWIGKISLNSNPQVPVRHERIPRVDGRGAALDASRRMNAPSVGM